MWYNRPVIALLRSPLHGLLSRDTLLLTYTGRKSGAPYTLPVSYIGSGEHLLVLSTRGRSWWRNLRGGCRVVLRLRGRDVAASSEVLEEDGEVAEAIAEMIARRPQLARFFRVAPGLDAPGDRARLAAAAAECVVVRLRAAE